jgi:16S rRNA (uracil1498-N3)-methyltransferase
MTRVFVAGTLDESAEIALPEDAARHLSQVLRMRVGETLVLFNGAGGEYEATIVAAARREVRVRIGRFVAIDRESPLRLTLAQCVSKGERMDYTIQKAVELGVAAIAPLLSSRSVVKLEAERWEKKLDHWQGVIHSACEQAGRTRIPRLEPVRRLDAWLTEPPAGTRMVLAPGGTQSLKTIPKEMEITVLAGPEGGLSMEEVERAAAAGFAKVGLGPRILRTETAGVAALAALQALRGDLA